MNDSRFRMGSIFRFRMEDGSQHGSSGTFEVFEPPHRSAMSWIWESEPHLAHLDVALRPIAGGTEMTFTHSCLADAATRDSHEGGWNNAFDKLEAKAGDLEAAP